MLQQRTDIRDTKTRHMALKEGLREEGLWLVEDRKLEVKIPLVRYDLLSSEKIRMSVSKV